MGAYLSFFKNLFENFFVTIKKKKKSRVFYKEAEEFPERLRKFTKSPSIIVSRYKTSSYCYLPAEGSFQYLPDVINYSINESWIMNISFSTVISRFVIFKLIFILKREFEFECSLNKL